MAHDASFADLVPQELREAFFELIALTDKYCDELLTDEYKELCRRLTASLCHRHRPPSKDAFRVR